ncbi:arylamine N-acetyltransferase family protein [Devosia submarina]|uniref:arylamine N-acetyltransferase family protein n=1 Tax=Devosia submarina TaxID=1173082 RepID=UPI000D3D90F6|nr:arylamine N-acetyltransferase [Devosia submarina]
MSQKVNLNGYFERIGFAGSIAPTLATLELISALHPAAIAFENLDPLLGEPVKLDLASLQRKLLSDGRGGYCFEHNLLLMAMLRELEFTVRGHAARVLWNNPEGLSAAPTHMVLTVEIGGTQYLVDAGFGGMTLTAPLKLKTEAEQSTPHEKYRLINSEKSWQLEARIGEEWKALYVFDLAEQTLEDYEGLNRFVSSDPGSAFTRELRVALSPSGRRLALHNNRFTIHAEGQEPERRMLESVEALRAVLSEEFGISLPEAEKLNPELEAILADAQTDGR